MSIKTRHHLLDEFEQSQWDVALLAFVLQIVNV